MKLEEQVVSLELAKRLKELGVKQDDSLFQYVNTEQGGVPWFLGHSQSLRQFDSFIAAFTVAEIGEMLPQRIKAEEINHAYPIPQVKNETDEEWEALETAREKLRDAFNALEWDYDDQFDDGMPYDIKLDFQDGKNIRYWQETDDWECNYSVIEISGDSEADARAKMLIYLIENKLVTL